MAGIVGLALMLLGLAAWLEKTWMGWAAAALALSTPLVLLIQCCWMSISNRGRAMDRLLSATQSPRPPTLGLTATVGVWWREVGVAWRVFGWQQPWRWRAEPNFAWEAPIGAAAPRVGVVFVHGYFCNRGLWQMHMRRLRERGVPYIAVNLEPAFGSIDEYAPILEGAVGAMEQMTGAPAVLVCHSMGGLAARAWLRTTHADRVRTVITIGTPHFGTAIAAAAHTPNGRQMRLLSPWLQKLRSDESEIVQPRSQPAARFVCVYSDGDNIVFPYPTAILPGSEPVFIPACGHVELVDHPTVAKLIDRLTDQKTAELRRQ